MESPRELVGRDAVPLIAHADRHVAAGGHLGPVAIERFGQVDHPGLDADLAAVGHGVAGVHHEVHDDLVELPPVGPDRQQAGIMAEGEGDFLADQPVEQVHELAHGVAQIQRLGLQRLLAREGQQLPDQRGGAVGVLVDLHEIGIVRVALVVAQHQQVAMPGDGGQQVVEVMRDAPGKLTDGLHLLALNELALHRLELGRVVQHRQKRGARRIRDPAERDLHEKLGVAAPSAHNLGAVGNAFGQRVHNPVIYRPTKPLDEARQRALGLGRHVEQALRMQVRGQQPTVRPDMQQGDRQRLEGARGHRGGGRLGQPGHGIDLAPPILGGNDHGDDLDGAVRRLQARAPPGHQRRVAEHLGQRGRAAAKHAAHRRVHGQDRVGAADHHHRQADPLAGRVGGAGQIVEPPEDPRAQPIAREFHRATRGHDRLVSDLAPVQRRLVAKDHSGGIGQNAVDHPRHGRAPTIAEAACRRLVRGADRAGGIGAEARRGIMGHQPHRRPQVAAQTPVGDEPPRHDEQRGRETAAGDTPEHEAPDRRRARDRSHCSCNGEQQQGERLHRQVPARHGPGRDIGLLCHLIDLLPPPRAGESRPDPCRAYWLSEA
jgi:hypothetical protein